MNYRMGHGAGGILGFPPAISQLVLVNAIIFLAQMLLPESMLYRVMGVPVGMVPNWLGLVPLQVVTQGMVWQLFTYMFLHGGLMHVLLNMFYLVMFGTELERWWGSREFFKYYSICGVGAGVIHVLTTYIFGGNPIIPTVGASGAVFGILIAFGMAFPQRQIMLWFVIPVSARTLVAVAAFIELAMTVEYRGGDGVARFAHLGGMLVGYLYLKQDKFLWRAKRWLGEAQRRRPPRASGMSDADEEARVNEILDKYQRDGKISDEDRDFLHDRAERRRGRGTD